MNSSMLLVLLLRIPCRGGLLAKLMVTAADTRAAGVCGTNTTATATSATSHTSASAAPSAEAEHILVLHELEGGERGVAAERLLVYSFFCLFVQIGHTNKKCE